MPERILIADDEADMTSLLAFNLDRAGYAVATAHNGSEAFEKARLFMPDAIVLDVQMPELDGIDVCRLLRDWPATQNIPILIITGRSDEKVRTESERYGAADFLRKPFSPRDLVNRVRAALDRRRD